MRRVIFSLTFVLALSIVFSGFVAADPSTSVGCGTSAPSLMSFFGLSDSPLMMAVTCTKPTAACGTTTNPVGTRKCSITASADCTCQCGYYGEGVNQLGWLCSSCSNGCDSSTNKCKANARVAVAQDDPFSVLITSDQGVVLQ